MNEIILIIIITFVQSPTELYEYPVDDIETCLTIVKESQHGSNTTLTCANKPKLPTVAN